MVTWGSKKPRSARKPTKWTGPPRSVSRKVADLSQKVNRLAKTDVSHIKYQQTLAALTLQSALGTQNYYSFPMTSYAQWGRIFGTDADDETGKTALLRNMNLKFALTTNEPDVRSYSLFIVKLKKLGGNLGLGTSLGSLTAGQHYVNPPFQTGDVVLNDKYFQTLFTKRWTFGTSQNTRTVAAIGAAPAVTEVSLGDAPGQTEKHFGRNINFGKSGLMLSSASGDWKAALYPPSITSQIYCLIFYNDSNTDGEYAQINMNAVISVDV